jgi:Cys-tRNA synthase (O-phospho-L-seryl-tRNA:Cys-tRNA synthase)
MFSKAKSACYIIICVRDRRTDELTDSFVSAATHIISLPRAAQKHRINFYFVYNEATRTKYIKGIKSGRERKRRVWVVFVL